MAKIRVYTDVVGDLFHWGHVNLFRRLRELGDELVVGVSSDELVAGYKRLPVLNLEERARMIGSCRYVDEVIPGAPAPITEEFLAEHQITIVARGDDFSPDGMEYWYGVPMRMGIFKTVPYTAGVSTSDIIQRIIDRRHELTKKGENE